MVPYVSVSGSGGVGGAHRHNDLNSRNRDESRTEGRNDSHSNGGHNVSDEGNSRSDHHQRSNGNDSGECSERKDSTNGVNQGSSGDRDNNNDGIGGMNLSRISDRGGYDGSSNVSRLSKDAKDANANNDDKHSKETDEKEDEVRLKIHVENEIIGSESSDADDDHDPSDKTSDSGTSSYDESTDDGPPPAIPNATQPPVVSGGRNRPENAIAGASESGVGTEQMPAENSDSKSEGNTRNNPPSTTPHGIMAPGTSSVGDGISHLQAMGQDKLGPESSDSGQPLHRMFSGSSFELSDGDEPYEDHAGKDSHLGPHFTQSQHLSNSQVIDDEEEDRFSFELSSPPPPLSPEAQAATTTLNSDTITHTHTTTAHNNDTNTHNHTTTTHNNNTTPHNNDTTTHDFTTISHNSNTTTHATRTNDIHKTSTNNASMQRNDTSAAAGAINTSKLARPKVIGMGVGIPLRNIPLSSGNIARPNAPSRPSTHTSALPQKNMQRTSTERSHVPEKVQVRGGSKVIAHADRIDIRTLPSNSQSASVNSGERHDEVSSVQPVSTVSSQESNPVKTTIPDSQIRPLTAQNADVQDSASHTQNTQNAKAPIGPSRSPPSAPAPLSRVVSTGSAHPDSSISHVTKNSVISSQPTLTTAEKQTTSSHTAPRGNDSTATNTDHGQGAKPGTPSDSHLTRKGELGKKTVIGFGLDPRKHRRNEWDGDAQRHKRSRTEGLTMKKKRRDYSDALSVDPKHLYVPIPPNKKPKRDDALRSAVSRCKRKAIAFFLEAEDDLFFDGWADERGGRDSD